MNTKNGARIQLQGLTKTFGKNNVQAVDNVNLEIQPGEFMTFLGPSGSGKTTTLNMIAGFTDASQGSILIDGTDIAKLPPYERNLGMVFQQYALFPHMTVTENIAFPLQRRKVSKDEIERRVAEVINQVHLNGMENRYPKELSGGQQQRVAVARSIVFGPRVLLMDEPLGALDKKLREKLQTEIAKMHKNLGLTIVFVTHDQHEALALSDRIAVFNNGKIEQVGTAEELYERPASLFVADFIGDSTILKGRLTAEQKLERHDGVILDAQQGEEVQLGEVCSLVLRPERIKVSEADDAVAESMQSLDATVSDIAYFGEYRKIYLDLGNDEVAVAKENAGEWSTVQVNSRVKFSWDVENSILVSGHM